MSKIRPAMSADYEPLFPCVLDDDDVDRLLERLRAVHGEPRQDSGKLRQAAGAAAPERLRLQGLAV